MGGADSSDVSWRSTDDDDDDTASGYEWLRVAASGSGLGRWGDLVVVHPRCRTGAGCTVMPNHRVRLNRRVQPDYPVWA